MKVALDINVVMDILAQRSPHVQLSDRVLNLIEYRGDEGYLAGHDAGLVPVSTPHPQNRTSVRGYGGTTWTSMIVRDESAEGEALVLPPC